jgi:hypothetical protein
MHTTPYAPTHDQAADAYTAALLEQLRLDHARHRIRVATRRHTRAGVAVATARRNRDDAIRAALAAGESPADVAAAARLTTMRIRQIRRHTR